MKAEIIAVGSELLTPYRLDTNSLFITERLNALGIEVTRKVVVGDDKANLRRAFEEALNRVELVIGIGGLGPTEDDLTREVLADLLGRKLQFNEQIMRGIAERFRRFGRQMPENNRRQAMVPEGAVPLDNPRGTAPGLWLEFDGHIVALLPGPPSECKPMFPLVEERLARHAGGLRMHSRELRIAGMSESGAEAVVAPIYTLYPDVQTTILAAPGEVQLHLRMWTADAAGAQRVLDEMVQRMTVALGENLFTARGESMEEVVARELNMRNATIAVAESCTGGLVAERLTRIAGSSSYFLGGVICYSNEIKSAWVDVPAQMIEQHGAVSAEVAGALADGIRRRSRATFGLGITGIAGPGGGSPEKPVGTVHIALADSSAPRGRAFHFPGDRERVRMQASQAALDMLRRYLIFGPNKPK